MPSCENTRRHFTDAAREAAAAARQRKREHRVQFPQEHQLVMVVVRAGEGPRGFAWQIRRYGHMRPVAESAETFAGPEDAERAGQSVLDDLRSEFVGG